MNCSWPRIVEWLRAAERPAFVLRGKRIGQASIGARPKVGNGPRWLDPPSARPMSDGKALLGRETLTCYRDAPFQDRRMRPDMTAQRKEFAVPRSNSFFSAPLATVDPEIAGAIDLELQRQRDEIELIASENIVSRAVLEAQGSVMTNKYAEGYPGRRYYGGCQF